jgi:hypothetical protein
MGADVVVGAVLVELLVDLARNPQQCQLTESGEIADTKIVAQGSVDLVWRVNIAVY